MPFLFPLPGRPVFALLVALHANGESSYRDARSLHRLLAERWGARVTVFTDKTGVEDGAHVVRTATDLLDGIRNAVEALPHGAQLLFAVSSHGYSMATPPGAPRPELDGRSEFVRVRGQRVMDWQLHEALYSRMGSSVRSFAIVDTCHSGTMLDLEGVHVGKVPQSCCVSACSDAELAGEDISDYGGWGGKLVAQFLDAVPLSGPLDAESFHRGVARTFAAQRRQRSHPVLSFQ